MRKNQQNILAALAVAGLFAAAAGGLSAGEPGIVRISDYAGSRAAVKARQVGHENVGCPNCGKGGCNSCGDNDGGRGSLSRLLSSYRSPDHGWGRPIKRPINRLPVLYQRYYPNAWTGQRGAGYTGAKKAYFPMVYMPTDTTQLGYYYQRTPFWRPNPSMTPPVPWPAHWHRREGGAMPFGHDFTTSANGRRNNETGSQGQPGCRRRNGSAPHLKPIPEPAESEEPPPIPKNLNETAQRVIR